MAAGLHVSIVMLPMTHEALLGQRSMRARTTISEVMTTSPYTIDCNQRLAHAHDLMEEHRLRHLPVLDGDKLVGVISDRDLYFVEAIAGTDRQMDRVSEAISGELFVVAPGDCVGDVARTMARHRFGCAVVVDRGHVVGIFTASDALALLAKAMP